MGKAQFSLGIIALPYALCYYVEHLMFARAFFWRFGWPAIVRGRRASSCRKSGLAVRGMGKRKGSRMHKRNALAASVLAVALAGGAAPLASASPDDAAAGSGGSTSVLPASLQAQLEDGSLGKDGSFGDEASRYAPDDVVTLIVQLEGPSLADADAQVASLASTRSDVKAQIADIVKPGGIQLFGGENHGLDVVADYTTVMNGFAVRVPYKDVDAIKAIDGVKAAFPEHTYSVPVDQGDGAAGASGNAQAQAQAASGNNDQYFNANSLNMVGAGANGLTGKKTATAIIDSGLDVNHEAFSGALDADSLDLTKDEIAGIAGGKDFNGRASYVSDKIPYAYDYADGDTDVVPHNDGLEHGTHVAGIIGANAGDKIRGVSPDTQLLAMKVASDSTGALYDSAIISALDDAAKLGVDSINMSLGSDAGFPADKDSTYNDIYNAVKEKGIQLNVAAGNSTSSAQGNKSGKNLPYASDPDYSIVSSPATYDASLAVASVDALDKGMYLKTADGREFPYKASSADSATLDSLDGTFKVVDSGYGHPEEIPDSVAGNIALIERGSADPSEQFAFADKVKNAIDKGARAVIVYNNVDETTLQAMQVDDTRAPSVFVSKEAGEAIKAAGSVTVSPTFSKPATQMTMSDFSSWGVSPNLELKPEITAPGGQIYSSVLNGAYEYMSGTSMATPQVAGLAASMYQYLEQKYPDKPKTEVYDLSEALLMSTASPVTQGEGSYVSPRKQGAGEANLEAASNSPAYLSVEGAEANKPKADLGDSTEGSYQFTFTVHNLSDQALSYTLDAAALGENIADGFFQNTSANYAGKGVDVTFSTGDSVNVPANGTADVTVSIKAGDAFKKAAAAAPNGTFLDGFVMLKAPEGGVDLSVPYLGFYGDWQKVPIFDAAAGTGEDAHMFQTIVGSPDSSAMLGANVLNDGKENNPARFALSPNSMGDYFKRFTTNTGLLRNASKVSYSVAPKDDPSKVVRQYDYDSVAKSYFVTNANAVSYGEAFLSDKPVFDTKDKDGNTLPDGWYTFKEQGFAASLDDPQDKTVDDTYSFDFYVDSKAPTVDSVKVSGEGADKVIKVTVSDEHYVSAVELTSYNGQESLGKAFEGSEKSQVEKDGRHVYEFDFKYDDVKAKADAAGMPMSSLNVAAYDYALNQASEQQVLEKAYPESIAIDQIGTNDDGSMPLMQGKDMDLTVTFTPDYTTERKITWSTDDAAKVKVDADGHVSALAPTAEGSPVYVTAQAEVGPDVAVPEMLQAALGFTVEAIPAETGIVINRDALDLDEGATATLRATTTDALKDAKVVWKSSNEKAASIEQNDDGTVTVTASKSGKADVTATVEQGGKTYTATTSVSVSSANDRLYDMDENGVVTGYHGSSPDLVLPTNATAVDAYAFAGLNVRSVVLPAGLKSIGNGAFQGDEELTSVTIPEDSQLESIGDNAFDGDKALSGDFTFPETFTSLGESAFQGTIVKGVDLSKTKITEIKDYTFNNATSLASVKLPKGVKSIGLMSFTTTVSLTHIDLPEGLETIGNEAFNGGALTSFKAPSTLKSIGRTALGGLPLGEVELNEGLETIGDTAFSGVGATELRIPDSVTSIGEKAFEGMSSLRSISLGGENPVPVVPFVEDYQLRTIEVRDGAKHLANGTEGELLSADKATLVAYPIGALAKDASYVLPDTVKTVAAYAFYGAVDLSGLTLGTHVETIEDHAFMTSGVKEVVVPEGAALKTIGDNAFYLDKALEKVDLGTSVTSIGAYSFSESPVLASVSLGAVQSVGDFAFAKSTALTELTFPDTVTKVGTSTLQNSPAITKVHVGKGVPALDSDTFVGLTGLTEITVSDGNANLSAQNGVLYTKAGSGLTLTFYPSAKADEEFVAPKGVVAIADGAVSQNPYLKKATFPDGLKAIGTSAFNGTANLAELDLPESVTTVGSVAFSGTSIETIRLGKNVESFGGSLGVFSLSPSLKHIVIEGGKNLAVPDNFGLDNLETVYVGPGVTSLSSGSFSDAAKLKSVVVNADLTAAPAGALPSGATVYVGVDHPATRALLEGQGYTVKPYSPLSVTLAATPAQANPGDKVSVTAQAAGGIDGTEYRFVQVAADGSETELQGWSDKAELEGFTLPESGTAHVRAYVRDASQVSVSSDVTVGPNLAEGAYAAPAQLLTPDGSGVSGADGLMNRTAHIVVAKDGSATVKLGFQAGTVTAVQAVAAGQAGVEAAAAPDDPFEVKVADLNAPTPVSVTTSFSDKPVQALLSLDLGKAQASANVGDLAAALDQAWALNPTRYSADTWKALVSARDAAEAAYERVGTSQADVNAATSKLHEAIDGLKSAAAAEWPANGTYDVAIKGQNTGALGDAAKLFGDTAQVLKDDTGTYLLITVRPATVDDVTLGSHEADATMIDKFRYVVGQGTGTFLEAPQISASADGKTAVYKIAINDVSDVVGTSITWKQTAPIVQYGAVSITMDKDTLKPAVTPDAADQSALAEAYNRYAALDLGAYEDGDAKDAFKQALDAAKAVLAKPESTADQVKAAKDALDKAAAGLVPSIGREQLSTFVDQTAKNHEGKELAYTGSTWKAYADALAKAQAVVKNDKATDPEVSAAWRELMGASLDLVRAADMTALNGEIAVAQWVDLGAYEDGPTKDVFTAALTAARNIAADRELTAASQQHVDDAQAVLAAAQKALVPKAASSIFADVEPGSWYEESVQFANAHGLMTGYEGTNLFGVNDSLTRAQLVAILFRVAGGEGPSDSNETGLPDVEANQWYTASANWAVKAGVITGVEQPDGSRTFEPDMAVDRETFVTMLANYLKVAEGQDSSAMGALPDAGEVDPWAANAMAWAVNTGIVSGVEQPDGSRLLAPHMVTDRQTAAAILTNAVQAGVLR